ncbi:uncharacterized protein F4822DRAFT_424456 [Hypoxylon trugodes]|uniref:uncharacterized protein n=1 Tax=Hypoxylon trugodes TaxID=326681 RepID=UPI002190EB69|nr:uncharacterized protein F4822DRAFT_424456 [Hypoxylon trugodes]KAI1393999.1 hypothetical protein F4822DRAFT_424456 [Hypoxylon trugodes]
MVVTWSDLSQEIRQMILSSLGSSGTSIAPYAAVSKEWQQSIEAKNFKHLAIRYEDFDAFGKLSRPHQKLVEHIQLCMELKEYDCNSCESYTLQRNAIYNEWMLNRSTTQFFKILKNWDIREEGDPGLTLEINIYSPSDFKHAFKHYEHGNHPTDDGGVQNITDARHGWYYGLRLDPPDAATIDRVHGFVKQDYRL